jgi:hypothetical protein
MRSLTVILVGLTACAPAEEAAWAPVADWSLEQVPTWDVLTEGLVEPRGIAWWQEAWYVAERGDGRVVRIANGEVTPFAKDLVGPWGLLALGDQLLVTDRDDGKLISFDLNGDSSVLLDGLLAPTELLAIDGEAYLLDEEDGSLWKSSSPEALVEGLEKPTSLDHSNGVIYISESGSPDRLSSYSIADNTIETYASNADIPYGVSANDDGVFFTGRSTRWPYAGWVYGGETGSSPALCESPPGIERIVATAEYLIWNTYESILRCPVSGGPYEMLAPETAVGSIVVLDEVMTWTDRQRGAVYQTSTTPDE